MPRSMLSSRCRRAGSLLALLAGFAGGAAQAADPFTVSPVSGEVFDQHLLGHSQPNCSPCPPRGTMPYQQAPSPYQPAPYSEMPDGAPQPAPLPQPTDVDQVFVPQPQGSLLAASDIAAGLSSVGYIDPAVPQSQFRLRFDAGYDFGSPDRAEFFYAKCGCVRELPPTHPLFDPNAPGPDADAPGPQPETNIDSFQDIAAYVELAANGRFSVFGEFPVRFLNPEVNENTAGYADMNVGFKYALLASADQYLTLQFRTYLPTGDADRGLGTDHFSLEPGLLYFARPAERLILEAEFKGWVPIDGTEFAGEILRYGVGGGYIAWASPSMTITPTLEFVGWTILDGFESTPTVRDVGGDTIVNIKPGVRFGWGEPNQYYVTEQSLYVGYGTPITGREWYEDIFRVEYRMLF